ncbi:2-oxo-4-hydroxy-4-carboxy-5-ureidoimidazoline decarboxylase [Celerinatantimonas sp. YJH-8]|uniref:2-oxo-4-hydroxy-4-carboxy-5-ureidoimidazoline decarboxylase n=1 Tax=Celerinatantimonas sp. YJH-8 TaxID=3228714 RepID=UPI0038C6E7D2
MQLHHWNQLDPKAAREQIKPCVAIREWAVQLTARRPYLSYEAMQEMAMVLMADWDEEALDRALQAHPRIGEKKTMTDTESAFSRQEQSSIDPSEALTQALSEGNQRYEQRFGRVFLIRAKGRSGEQILDELNRRLQLDAEHELAEALEALKAITLLRLETLIQP